MEYDVTEASRRRRLAAINSAVQSQDEKAERQRLSALYGQVWDAGELGREFEVLGFLAPYVVVKRRSDGRNGSLEFEHRPRFYFNFVLD